MGKHPNEFVPLKYASQDQGQSNSMLNFLIGGTFVFLLFQLYRSMHGKGKGPNVKGKGSSGTG